MVLGHEPTGTIAALGAGVSGWTAGDPVACEPAIYCYHCEFCLAGRHNVCANIRFMSTPVEPGYFRELANVPAVNVIAPPAGVGLAEATLFEPLAIVLHSMKFAAPSIGDTALVYGAGPIGLLTVAVLKIQGVSRIWCVEPLAHRREMARTMGATAVFDPRETDVVATIRAETHNRGVDIAIDCATPDPALGCETINECIRAARNAGRVIVTGIPGVLSYPLDIHSLRVKELYLYTVRRSNHESCAAIDLLETHPMLLGPLVTHSAPPDRLNATFEMLVAGEEAAGKAVISF
jgi:threonine dehydrogenase-like Zn-dependent dehydrogenase